MAKDTTKRLSERAMLADLTVGFWTGSHKNKTKSEEVVQEAKADNDAGSWWTRVIPPRMLTPLRAVLNKARSLHWKYTLPWMNDGARILPAAMFQQYAKEMRELKGQWLAAVAGFVEEYPEIAASARQRLGDLYEDGMYPDASEIADKFRWQVHVFPMPDVDDFRVDLAEDEVTAIKGEMQSHISHIMEDAMRDCWARLHQSVSHIVERLSDPDHIFRDSLITNLVQLIDLLPKLNVTGDADLERMRQEVAKHLSGLKPGELRDNQTERSKAADAAQAILDKMGQFYTPAK